MDEIKENEKEEIEEQEPGIKQEPEVKEVEDQERAGKKKKLIIWVLILSLLAVGTWYFVSPLFKATSKSENVNKEAATPSPTPEPTPALVRSEWSFEILNGSGVTGAAKKIADQLRQLGYIVIKSGNADKDNYEQTQIFVREDLKDKLDLVIVDLKDIVKIASAPGELKDSTASARIILGKE